jgi:hypothetical protein
VFLARSTAAKTAHPDGLVIVEETFHGSPPSMADRDRLVGRLRQLKPKDWTRTARHDEYNSYSVFTMFRHLALHDFFHAYRIEELLLRKKVPDTFSKLTA